MFAVRERRVARFSNAGFSKISNPEIFISFLSEFLSPLLETRRRKQILQLVGGGEMEGIVNDR